MEIGDSFNSAPLVKSGTDNDPALWQQNTCYESRV